MSKFRGNDFYLVELQSIATKHASDTVSLVLNVTPLVDLDDPIYNWRLLGPDGSLADASAGAPYAFGQYSLASSFSALGTATSVTIGSHTISASPATGTWTLVVSIELPDAQLAMPATVVGTFQVS